MKRLRLAVLAAATIAVLSAAGWAAHAQAENEAAEQAAMTALDEFMTAFNARDDAAWAKTLNYPHVRVAGGEVRVWQNADEYIDYMDFDRFIQQTGWHHSQWDERTIVQSGKDKVHIAVQFSRYNKDNEKIATYESLYIVTNDNGRWGTQARSSFAP